MLKRLKTFNVIKLIYQRRNITNLIMPTEHILYGDLASPPVRFVLITASLLGLKLKFQNIDIFNSENKSDFFKKLTPLQKVPVLATGDEILCDSHAIAQYLCHKTEKQDLYPTNSNLLLKARVDEMLFFNATTLFPVDSAIFCEYFARMWPASDTNLNKWHQGLDYLEHRLTQFKWLSGDKMLLSDICCAMTVSSLSVIIPIPDKYHKVVNWIHNLEQLPSFDINKKGIERLKYYVQTAGPKNV